MDKSPFHAGELAVQKRTGEELQAKMNGTLIKAEILGGALTFISRQSMIIIATHDRDGKPYPSIIFGQPGFLGAPDTGLLTIDLTKAVPHMIEVLLENLHKDPRAGTLIIELESRRRLKINGRVLQADSNSIELKVEESFPLCPKYIQRRKVKTVTVQGKNPAESPNFQSGEILGEAERNLLSHCDTFFLATSIPKGGIDVSHRGGNPGFVKVMEDGTLRYPDYTGNGMFNSLGNLELNKGAGILFVDFGSRQALIVTGTAQALFDQSDEQNETGGTNRFLNFKIAKWLRYALTGIEEEFLDYSPYNPTAQEDH